MPLKPSVDVPFPLCKHGAPKSQHESCRQHVQCRGITTHRFRSLPRTLQSTIKYNQDCNADILGTSSENTMRSPLVTTPTILHFLQDKVQASRTIYVIRTISPLLRPFIFPLMSLAMWQLCFVSCLAGGLLLLAFHIL